MPSSRIPLADSHEGTGLDESHADQDKAAENDQETGETMEQAARVSLDSLPGGVAGGAMVGDAHSPWISRDAFVTELQPFDKRE